MAGIRQFKDIDRLSAGDFEYFVRDLLLKSNWSQARVTKVGKEFTHGDGGVDILATKGDRSYAIEVKHRAVENLVDVKALNQLVTGAKLRKIQYMILITNGYFTSDVKVRALRLGVELIDRDQLHNLWIEQSSEIGRRIKPRKYQEAVIEEVLSSFKEGKNRILIEMATGLGKTYTVAHILRRLLTSEKAGLKVLFLSHRIEILLQTARAFKNIFSIGEYSFSACFSGADPEPTDFVFGTLETMFSKLPTLSPNAFDIIVIDEAHHVPARTYATVTRHFNPRLLVGLTATPFREDDKDVLAFFGGQQGHIGKYDLAWALKNRWLAFPRYLVLLDDLDQTKIDDVAKGLSISDLDKQLFLHKKDEEVIRIIEKTISEKRLSRVKAIVFCSSIKQLSHLIQFFPPGSATVMHSKMTEEARRNALSGFRDGDCRYILVCDLFNEGIDIPETNLLVFLRYTGSRTIWLQQLGRGLRKTETKDYVYVLDFVGSLERLYEIRELKKSIETARYERDKELDEPIDAPEDVHDTTLDVTYNAAAAQVLKLIEDLKFRLQTRQQAISALENYWQKNKRLPPFGEIEDQLAPLSCDQIATHFGSYVGYVKAAGLYEVVEEDLQRWVLAYVDNYKSIHKCSPSLKAISLAHLINNLLLATENQIEELLPNLLEYLPGVPGNSSHKRKHSDKDLRSENERLSHENKLFATFAETLRTAPDMKSLSAESSKHIIEVFGSLFLFWQRLEQWRAKPKS